MKAISVYATKYDDHPHLWLYGTNMPSAIQPYMESQKFHSSPMIKILKSGILFSQNVTVYISFLT